jgi:imidazolonepropionase-like amidohydrolase
MNISMKNLEIFNSHNAVDANIGRNTVDDNIGRNVVDANAVVTLDKSHPRTALSTDNGYKARDTGVADGNRVINPTMTYRSSLNRWPGRLSLVLSLLFIGLLCVTPAQAQTYAIKGETVYTMAGAPITDGVVLVRDGRIDQVGPASRVRIPAGTQVHEARVVTPGFIDARSVVGLAGALNHAHDQDQLEMSSPFQPELRAIDAYNAREHLVIYVSNQGITTIHTGHAPGAIASGQTMIAKTTGGTINEALIDSVTMVAFTLGPSVSRNYNQVGTRSRTIAMLRAEFIKAEEYRRKVQAADGDASRMPPRDLKMETMMAVLNGEIRALITAQQVTEILAALRLRDEFGFDLVLDGAAEAYLVLDQIKEAGIPVFVHPTMVRTSGETQNASWETAARLHEAGIPFAFQAGFEGYVPKTRIIHYEAAIAVANGLPFLAGLEAITIGSARILGIADRVGSLERGKDADIVLFDGDPFEYLTSTTAVMINGRWVVPPNVD